MAAARPEVWEENLLAYRAFWDLTAERYTGFAEGVIPWTVIQSYAEEVEVPPLELLRVLRKMDKTYLAYQKDKREAQARDDERRQRNANRKGLHRGR